LKSLSLSAVGRVLYPSFVAILNDGTQLTSADFAPFIVGVG
jgi:hypothetical protein